MFERLLRPGKGTWLFLAIIGPGLITAFADNDAGGISTYSIVGAHYGYKLLWMILIITVALAVVQEMCARMGAVTEKGLADLIRENFGVRWTMFAMLVLLLANIATTVANFAGIAASLKIFGIVPWIAVPVMAFFVWYTVVAGSYKIIERIFLTFGLVQISYIISGFIAKPDWGAVLHHTVVPTFEFNFPFVMIVIATIGTTITPWMQFFLQSLVVEKGITIKKYKYTRWDVFLGAFITDFVSFFIIVACAATLFKNGIMIHSAREAALALQPIAGRFAESLFAFGLFGASTLTASIVPVSSAYAVCEAFGWENGINKRFREAPVFYSLFTFMILAGAAVVMIPNLPLIPVMLFSQTANGILLPFILIFMLLLINNRRLMGKYVNTLIQNIIAITVAVSLILLTFLLIILPLIF